VLTLPFRELPVADPGTPRLSSPGAYLWWLASQQRVTLTLNMLFGVGWMLSQALLWGAVGKAIDSINVASLSTLFAWTGVVLFLGITQAICGMYRHQLAVTNWMTATYRSIQLVGRHVADHGTAVIDEIPAGDVVNTVASDAMRIGGAFDVLARFVGAIIAWIVVSIILLTTSLKLGLIVLVGVPVLASFTTPLMKPLHASQAAQREVAGRLAAIGADTVAGLRILRGVGGEDVFLANYKQQSERVRVAGNKVATPQAGLESGQVLLPAILMTIITYIGATDIMNGTLKPGQLVAFFGYATFLTTPLRTSIEYVIATTRARVGARKVLAILTTASAIKDVESPSEWPDVVHEYRDVRSGVTVPSNTLVALVTETPNEAATIADRLGRFTSDVEDVFVNELPIGALRLSDVRRHIVVSEIEPRLFTGDLRGELSPHVVIHDDELLAALEAASALDVLDAFDDGLNTTVEERGRSFSGGQRQRLTLARALLTNADLLVLVEPTSAVDSHTESRIAHRLRDARAGRATLIATTSPLMLEHVDVVRVVHNGVLVATGTHDDLLASNSLYRSIVLRGDDE